jgi:hypothetical protein
VGALIATPGEEEIDNRQSAGADGQANIEGMAEVIEADVVTAEADLSLVDREDRSYRQFP